MCHKLVQNMVKKLLMIKLRTLVSVLAQNISIYMCEVASMIRIIYLVKYSNHNNRQSSEENIIQ
jgi:hypothetical protein